jgi:hypothetical protein
MRHIRGKNLIKFIIFTNLLDSYKIKLGGYNQ